MGCTCYDQSCDFCKGSANFFIKNEDRHQISENLVVNIPTYLFAQGPCQIAGRHKQLIINIVLDTEPIVRFIIKHDSPEIVSQEIICDTYQAAARIYNAI